MKQIPANQKSKLSQLAPLFLMFLKLGAFTFGGGYAMISLLHEAVVEKKGWLSEDQMLEIIGIAESTPGPIAINMATYVGFKRAGILGALFATLGVVLPSLIIIFTISLVFEQFLANPYVAFAFSGIKIAVSLLIINAGLDMIKKLEKKMLPIVVLVLVIVMMIVIEIFHFSFSTIFLILIGGFIGIFVHGLSILKARTK